MSTPNHCDLPPDRSGRLTEQRNPRSMALHRMTTDELVCLIQDEDRAVLAAMEQAQPALTALIQSMEPGFLAGGRIVYVGAGTSGRLGVLDASEAPPTFQVQPDRIIALIAGGDSALRRSSESREDDPHGVRDEITSLQLTPCDTVIGIAAGGTTPYVLGALEIAKKPPSPPLTALIVCTPIDKPPAADHVVQILTGPEIITGSTRMKAGTATKLALNTISTTLMVRAGKVYENLMVDVRATNAKLRDRAARIIATLCGLSRPAAFELLDQADGSVKTAVVMHRLGVDRPEAQRRLALHHDRLDLALNYVFQEPRSNNHPHPPPSTDLPRQ